MNVVLRHELPVDVPGIRAVHERAFGRPEEGSLVDALRTDAKPQVSLVAAIGETIVGHIFLSPVTIGGMEHSFCGMGLAPLAVLPEFQLRGIGTQLVRAGLVECWKIPSDFVVVLGHPTFYRRFGFEPASTRGLRCEYPVAGEFFMVLGSCDLPPDDGGRIVKYHPAFHAV